MLVIRVPIYKKNDDKNYHKKGKYAKVYDQVNPGYKIQHSTYDLRLIILRHAERVDQMIGQDWYDQIFGGVPSAPLQAYKHPLLPQKLPVRQNTLLYVFDPPITRSGEQQSFYKGQQLSRVGATVDYCYSSPASRSILTANAILKGMNRSQVPIRLEPYLFEPMNWNSALLLLDKMHPFMSTADWRDSGYNIDQRYHRLSNYINLHENESGYYSRSQRFFESIERHHGGKIPGGHHGQLSKKHITILIVGHASSTEILSTIAMKQPFDPQSLGDQSANIPYLHAAVLERDALTHNWYIRSVL